MSAQLEPILAAYRFHERYACALTDDIPDDIASKSAGPGVEHHPVWIIGHLAGASALTADRLGAQTNIPPMFDELFRRQGPNDRRKPATDADYPDIPTVLAEYKRQHAAVERALRAAPEEQLFETVEWRLGSYLPRLIDMIGFMCMTHEAMHLGQLADWRRAMNLPGAMAGM